MFSLTLPTIQSPAVARNEIRTMTATLHKPRMTRSRYSLSIVDTPTLVAAACLAGTATVARKRHVQTGRCGRVTLRAAARALIFDCDGVMGETEGLHREAYNQAFQEFELSTVWSVEYYDELQNSIGGGKPKMRHHFSKHGWPCSKLGDAPTDEAGQIALVDALQARKTEIYKEMVTSGMCKSRPGILALVDEALARDDVKTAVCSASTKEAALNVLSSVLGRERVQRFDVLLLGDDVSKKKPDPLIYNLAAEKLNVSPADCAVIEDSKIGLEAALGASMACYITYTDSTSSQDFSGAKGVFPDATHLSLESIFSEH